MSYTKTTEQPPKKKRNIASKVAGIGAVGLGIGTTAAGLGVAGAAHQLPRLVAKGDKFATVRAHPTYQYVRDNKHIKKIIGRVKLGGAAAAVLGVGTMYAGYKAIRTKN